MGNAMSTALEFVASPLVGLGRLIFGSTPEQPRHVAAAVVEKVKERMDPDAADRLEKMKSQMEEEHRKRKRELEVESERAATDQKRLLDQMEKMRIDLQTTSEANQRLVAQSEKAAKEAREKMEAEQKRLEQLESEARKMDDELKAKRAEMESHNAKRHESKADADVRALRRLAQEAIGIDMVNKLNVAVAGQRGVGKSSTINGLRGLKAGDKGAAEVGVNEMTSEIEKYPHPMADHIVLWDVPGTGTLNHAGHSYFLDKFLFGFDYLLIMFTDNLGEAEIDLIKQAMAYHVPFAIVRNKVNVDFDSLRMDNKEFAAMAVEEASKKLIGMHRQKIVDTLKQGGIGTQNTQIFIINARAFVHQEQVKFEERKLVDHILKVVGSSRYQGSASQASASFASAQ